MARIIGIDYGSKRTGIAVSDPLQIIAGALETVATDQLVDYLTDYISREEVECLVVGEPKHMDGSPTQISHLVVGFVRKMQKLFPDIQVVMQDESFTSVEAKRAILMSGVKKKKRQDKGLVDRVSAAIILQEYMESRRKY